MSLSLSASLYVHVCSLENVREIQSEKEQMLICTPVF